MNIHEGHGFGELLFWSATSLFVFWLIKMKAKDCRELSRTLSLNESFWSLFGLTIDPYRTSMRLGSLNRIQIVDEPITVVITTYNAYGFR